MKKITLLLIMMVLLAACGGTETTVSPTEEAAVENTAVSETPTEEAAEEVVEDEGEETVIDEAETEAATDDTDDYSTIANTLIQLSDPLDEPEYYCIDVPGFGQSLNLDGALTAHTCKPNADDELFTINFPTEGQVYMPAYDRCMEARAAEANAELTMTACSDSPLQQFTAHDNGTIQLQRSDSEALCLAVANEAGEPTGGPSHLMRYLMLQSCASVSTALSQWVFPGADVP